MNHDFVLIVRRNLQFDLGVANGSIGEPQFQRHRAAFEFLGAQTASDLCSHGRARIMYIVIGYKVDGESGFARYGFNLVAGRDGRCVESEAAIAHHRSVLAVDRLEKTIGRMRQVAQRVDAMGLQSLFGALTDAGHRANGKRGKKFNLLTWINDGHPARFIEIRRDLRDGLAGADPNGARDAQIGDTLLNPSSDGDRMLGIHARRCDIQERLVDTDLLKIGAFVTQNVHDRA